MASTPPPLIIRPGQDCVLGIRPGKVDSPWIYWVRRRHSGGWTTSFIHVSDIDHIIPAEPHRYSRDQSTNYLRIWLGDAWLDPSWTDLYIKKNGDNVTLGTRNHTRATASPTRPSNPAVHVDVMNLGLVADEDGVANFTTMFAGEEATARILPFDDQVTALNNELRTFHAVASRTTRHCLLPRLLAYVFDGTEANVVGFVFKVQVKEPRAEHLEACNNALTELHSYGILHGSLEGNVAMSTDGPLFLDLTSARFREDDDTSPEQWKALSDAEHKQLTGLDIFRKPLHAVPSSKDTTHSRPASFLAPKTQHQQATASDIWSVPINENPLTRRGQLRQRTQAFCDAFADLSSNPPEKMLDVHFAPDPKITEHGPRSGRDNDDRNQQQRPVTNLPFLGRTFVGREDCLEYFRLLADTLAFEPGKDTFPDPDGFVIDAEAVGPDEASPQPGFGGMGVVCVVGKGRFRSLDTGKAWNEQFIYRLSGFDDRSRIGHWEIWADPLSAYFAVNGSTAGLKDG